MKEIAALIAAALSDNGYETVFPSPGLPEEGSGRVNLVVAPHEFFLLQPGHTQDELLKAAGHSVVIGVEQPGTQWFELGYRYAELGPCVIDISRFAVRELARRGLETTHLQLGYHPSLDQWGGDVGKRRNTDLLFLGASTERRDEILSYVGSLLWEFNSDIRLFEFPHPMDEPRGHFVAGRAKWQLLANSRVLLNIHRNETPYFEWVRVLEAACNGALIVTELSSDYGPLSPGEHFIAAPSDCLAAQTASVLYDESLRSELALAAYDFVRSELDLRTSLLPICDQLNRLAFSSRPRTRRPRRSPPAQPSVGTSTSHPILAVALDVERQARVRIKELLDSETNLVQKVEALQSVLLHGDPNHVESRTTAAWGNFAPDVSVVITCYNYAHFVRGAIESVIANSGIKAELIVVDDHSMDDSVQVISELMREYYWFPIRLLARSANAGLGAARDVGVRHSRSDRVFMLDADNTIFPNCLSRLSQALDDEPDAAFAYGIICRFGKPGLLSQFPWDVSRLAKENYIDAMALLRKKVLEEVGGYDASLRGWEDYELWLRIADHGHQAAFVPKFVGSYRVHGESLLQTVNIDVSALFDQFRTRYPFLPWDQP